MEKDDLLRRWIRAYFDLCSEEVKLACRGHIPDEVWQDWEEGMRSAMNSSVCNWAWEGLGFRKDYTVLRLFLEGKAKGLTAACEEYSSPKEWRDGNFV